jgi:hypothetical protein
MTCHARDRVAISHRFSVIAALYRALISPLRGQLLPEGEAFGAAKAKSLLPWEKVSPKVTDEVRTGTFSHWFHVFAASYRAGMTSHAPTDSIGNHRGIKFQRGEAVTNEGHRSACKRKGFHYLEIVLIPPISAAPAAPYR